MGRSDHRVREAASQSRPIRPNQNRSPSPNHLRIQRTRHMPEPRTDDRNPRPTPVPATMPMRRRTTSSARSDTAPSPRAQANPGPAVVRLPSPVAILIGSPTIRLIRHPDLTVVGRVFPGSVGVEILRSDVILVGVAPGTRLRESCGRARLFQRSQSSRSGAGLILYFASAPEPRTVAMSPCFTVGNALRR